MDNNLIDISIVVPVYNSSQTISVLVERVRAALGPTAIIYELILTDDGSTDTSWQEILKVCQLYQQVIGVRLNRNYGQWCSSLAGMSIASGKYIVTMDDDLEYDPSDIPCLYRAIIAGNYLVVFGMAPHKYRLQNKSPWLSTLRNRLLGFLWNKPPTDSFKILNSDIAFKNNVFSINVPFEVFIRGRIEKQLIGYYPVAFNKRHSGNSNYSFLKKVRMFFLFSSYYVANPVKKIGLFSLLFIILTSACTILFKQQPGGALFTLGLIFLPASFLCVALYYIFALLSKPKGASLYTIAQLINRTNS